ncbi:MAG TPA: hypothetical protein VMB71_08535 [Acetobacteraceae bacterium]|nr:hypothetical protein [Acetobacteraceae bacterium]
MALHRRRCLRNAARVENIVAPMAAMTDVNAILPKTEIHLRFH